MNVNTRLRTAIGGAALLAAQSSWAHPGHEPEDLLHALAHELASPRGILALILLAAVGVLWKCVKSKDR
jgi:hypothetical protein